VTDVLRFTSTDTAHNLAAREPRFKSLIVLLLFSLTFNRN
jgi:hypothetical protein